MYPYAELPRRLRTLLRERYSMYFVGRIDQDRNASRLRNDLMQLLQPLCRESTWHKGSHASQVPAGAGEARSTIGMVDVVSLRARLGCGDDATIRSGPSATSSLASAGNWSARPAALRRSTTRF